MWRCERVVLFFFLNGSKWAWNRPSWLLQEQILLVEFPILWPVGASLALWWDLLSDEILYFWMQFKLCVKISTPNKFSKEHKSCFEKCTSEERDWPSNCSWSPACCVLALGSSPRLPCLPSCTGVCGFLHFHSWVKLVGEKLLYSVDPLDSSFWQERARVLLSF